MKKRFVFVITLTVMLIWSFSNADASDLFATAVKYPTGAEAYYLTTGDFNNDGNIDVATATYGDVSILLGKGDGTFQPAKTYSAGGYNYNLGIVAGDFNADRKLDLVVTLEYLGGISILIGNGDGTFQPVRFFSTGTNPLAITSEDFNGDGKADIAITNIFNYISILIGNGDGTFQLSMNYHVGDIPVAIITGDFNNDGVVDLVTANMSSFTISILIGNGDGTFQAAGNYGAGFTPSGIATGDFNGDGKADLAVTIDVDSMVSFFLGNGDGTFQPKIDYSYGGNRPYSVTVGDFNGDHKLDLATSTSGNVSVFIGNGDGTFQPKIDYATGDTNNYQIAAKDLDNDGQLDLITANGAGYSGNSVSVLLNIYNKPTPIPPVVTLYTTPTVLWPPSGKMMDVFVGGDVYDPDSAVAHLVFTVTDEYGRVQPTISGFNTGIKLEARCDGKDKDGRHYTISVIATDATGNTSTASTVVLVPHDQSK